MTDDIEWVRMKGRLFGLVVWAAIAAGGFVLGAAGASDVLVALFAGLAVLGFVVLGVRAARRR
jgi:hypothetical protein